MMTRKKLTVVIIATAVAVVVLCAITFSSQGFLDMYRLYREDKAAEQKIAAAQAEIDSLKREVELLKSDTAYIEKVAREKLGMARKDEIIYKFVEESGRGSTHVEGN